MTRLLLSLVLALALSGCLPQAEGDGRPFAGRTGPGFSLGVTNKLDDNGKDGRPNLSFLQTFDLNWASPGGTPSDSQPFYIFGADEKDKVVITKILIVGRNPEDFQIVGVDLPLTLGYQEYNFFRVRFAPKVAAGDRSATIVIYSDTGHLEALRVQANSAPDKGEISILRDGYEAFNLSNLADGLKNGASFAQSVAYQMGACPKPFEGLIPLELKNLGPAPLHIERAELTLDEKKVFSLDPSVVFPLDIAPGQSQMVNVVLDPAAADGTSFNGRVAVQSGDTNEPKYEFDVWIYKPVPAPCLSVIPHDPSQAADPNVNRQNYDLGVMGATKVVALKLLNAGSARLTIDEGKLSVSPLQSYGSICDTPTAVLDLANGGGPVVLEPGESHEASLTISGTTNCAPQAAGITFPMQLWIQQDGPSSYPIVQMRGQFTATIDPLVQVTYGRNHLSIANGGTLSIPSTGMPIGLSKRGPKLIDLVTYNINSGDFKMGLIPPLPASLSATEISLGITKNVATPRASVLTLIFSTGERVILNLQ